MRTLAAVGVLALAAAGVGTAAPARTHRPALGGAVHGDLTLVRRDGSAVEVSFNRGEVTGTAGNSLTIERRDGKTVTVDVAPDALVIERGVQSSLADVAVGDRAIAFSRDGSVFLIRYYTPSQPSVAPRRLRATHRLGLLRALVHGDFVVVRRDGTTAQISYDRGEITAKSATSITLKRRDGQSVNLAVDGETVVRENRQRTTLDALAVGDPAAVFSSSGRAFLIRALSTPRS